MEVPLTVVMLLLEGPLPAALLVEDPLPVGKTLPALSDFPDFLRGEIGGCGRRLTISGEDGAVDTGVCLSGEEGAVDTGVCLLGEDAPLAASDEAGTTAAGVVTVFSGTKLTRVGGTELVGLCSAISCWGIWGEAGCRTDGEEDWPKRGWGSWL